MSEKKEENREMLRNERGVGTMVISCKIVRNPVLHPAKPSGGRKKKTKDGGGVIENRKSKN